MTIRVATPDDFDDIVALIGLMHVENGRAPLSASKVERLAARGTNRDKAIVGVIGAPGAIEASIGLFIESFWYSDAPLLGDLWNFVHPDHRRSTHAKTLIDWAKSMSDAMDIPLGMGVMSISRIPQKVALYERRLGPPVGAAFWHEPANGGATWAS